MECGNVSLAELSPYDRQLVEAARDASGNAYAPYSGFAVGAAVRTRSGGLHVGANLENASYGLAMCAEVAALTAANSTGDFDVEAIAISGHKFTDPPDSSQIVTPCGRCRQLIMEGAQLSRVDVRVFSCSGDLKKILELPISFLLPSAFGPANLGLVDVWPEMRTQLKTSLAALCEQSPGVKRAVQV